MVDQTQGLPRQGDLVADSQGTNVKRKERDTPSLEGVDKSRDSTEHVAQHPSSDRDKSTTTSAVKDESTGRETSVKDTEDLMESKDKKKESSLPSPSVQGNGTLEAAENGGSVPRKRSRVQDETVDRSASTSLDNSEQDRRVRPRTEHSPARPQQHAPTAMPSIPGRLVEDWQKAKILRRHVADLLHRNSDKFPGAQPVSFVSEHLRELRDHDYYVAEKSDGIRLLALLTKGPDGRPEVYLFDRHNEYYQVPHIRFPRPDDETFTNCHQATIIDGELVLDTERDGSTRLRYLTFDCLVYDGQLLIERPLDKRLGYLHDYILRPYTKMIASNRELARSQPFSVEFKEQKSSYRLDAIFNEIIPKLKHGNDGLIFTSVDAPYTFGTCSTMLKWKPANENSIDFKLVLEEATSADTDKPRFLLLEWCGERGGRDEYREFGELGVSDEEWEAWKSERVPLNNRIVEVVKDVQWEEFKVGKVRSPWRFMRFRDDKPHGNHTKTVDKVLQSINDGVSKEELLAETAGFRDAWVHRHGNQKKAQ